MVRSSSPHPTPLVVAHRAGNDLEALAATRSVQPDLAEADVHYFRGRLEIRHAKTLGPLRLLWDRHPWRLENPFAHQLTLPELLRELSPQDGLMLDLKGVSNTIVTPVIDAIETELPGREVTVASQNWQLLTRFTTRPWARVWYSVGKLSQVRGIFDRLDRADGVAIDHRLLDPTLARELRSHVPRVVAWTVNDRARWEVLATWGVNGLITDDWAMLSWAREAAQP